MKMKNKSLKKPMRSRTQVSLSQPIWDDGWPDEGSEPVAAALRFSPTAWAKLLYLRDQSQDEVGGFGISAADDLLYVQDFVTVSQEVSPVSVKFDDEAVSRFFDTQVDLGRKPEQFARVWLHSHPGDSPEPSSVDEDTFKRVFGSCQWAIMAIVARDSSTYARVSFNIGPGGQILIPTEVDYSREFGATDRPAWDAEYAAHVRAVDWFSQPLLAGPKPAEAAPVSNCAAPEGLIDELEKLGPLERQLILDELAERPDLWNNEQEVLFL
jgi:proteasome lid subunit RPN8/RPN11